MFVEIFKAGTHTDSQGRTLQYSVDQLDKIIRIYRNKLFETPNSEAPVVLGHPETSDSAKGWVKSLFRRGNSLIAQIVLNDNDFIESLRAGNYKNVSIALDNELNFIHLGFLGAVSPAVEGLNPMKYSALNEFSFYQDADINLNEMFKKIDELTIQNDEFSRKIEEYEQKIQRTSNTEFINSVLDSSGTSVFSDTQKENFLELMDMAFSLDKSSGETNHISKVKEIIGNIVKFTRYSEFSKSLSKSDEFTYLESRVEPERNSLHLKALSLMNTYPELSYEDAVLLSNN